MCFLLLKRIHKRQQMELEAAAAGQEAPKVDPRPPLSGLRLPLALLENVLGALKKLFVEIDKNMAAEHHALNKEMRDWVAELTALGRVLESDLMRKNGVEADGAHVQFCSRLLLKLTHTDDKSSVPDPHPKFASVESLYKHERILNGQADLIHNKFWALLG